MKGIQDHNPRQPPVNHPLMRHLQHILLLYLLSLLPACRPPAERLQSLIDAQQYEQAQALLSRLLQRDAACCPYERFLLDLRTADTLRPAALAQLALFFHKDSAAARRLPLPADRQRLSAQVSAADSRRLAAALRPLASAPLPAALRQQLRSVLYKKAVGEQLLAAWDSYLLFCEPAERAAAIRQRRRLLLQPDLFARQGIDLDSFLAYNPCYTPLLRRIDRVHDRAFTFGQLLNEHFPAGSPLAGRYLFADLNTLRADGNCRGSHDIFPVDEQLSEFGQLLPSLRAAGIDPYDTTALRAWQPRGAALQQAAADWRNYLQRVVRHRTPPMQKPPVDTVGGYAHCFGQRLCLCEVADDSLRLVAQFITSSKNAAAPQRALQDADGQPRYYAPRCYIGSRFWVGDEPYTPADRERDQRMGGGTAAVARYRGRVPLPNFMRMHPTEEFAAAAGYVNGLHEYAVGGSLPEKYMGAPVSLGCVRLYDYPSRFVRWWTPMYARMFISYENARYRRYPAAAGS